MPEDRKSGQFRRRPRRGRRPVSTEQQSGPRETRSPGIARPLLPWGLGRPPVGRARFSRQAFPAPEGRAWAADAGPSPPPVPRPPVPGGAAGLSWRSGPDAPAQWRDSACVPRQRFKLGWRRSAGTTGRLSITAATCLSGARCASPSAVPARMRTLPAPRRPHRGRASGSIHAVTAVSGKQLAELCDGPLPRGALFGAREDK